MTYTTYSHSLLGSSPVSVNNFNMAEMAGSASEQEPRQELSNSKRGMKRKAKMEAKKQHQVVL